MPRSRSILLWLTLAVSMAVPAAGQTGPETRLERLRSARVAPGPLPLTRAFLERQKRAGFNAVSLADVAAWDADTRRWRRLGVDAIRAQLALAREYGMSVFVCVPGVLDRPVRRDVPEDHATRLEVVPSAVIRERLAIWSAADRGEIVGVFFLGDDVFLLSVPAERQREWLAVAREVAPSIPVLGMVGEFGLIATPRERQDFFDPAAFDHLIWLNYPYHLGARWGRPLDHLASSDPDGDLVRYEQDYVAAMQRLFLGSLAADQLVIPVVQAFHYAGEPPGAVPRGRDIELQVRLLHHAIRRTLNQDGNFAMGYFHAGATELPDPFPVPRGIFDIPEWREAVTAQNAYLERRRLARSAFSRSQRTP